MKAARVSGTKHMLMRLQSCSSAMRASLLQMLKRPSCNWSRRLRVALSISARGQAATQQDLWPSDTRSSPSSLLKNFDVARCSCIRHR